EAGHYDCASRIPSPESRALTPNPEKAPLEIRAELPKRVPAMTHGRLPVPCFGQRASKRRGIEDRVVTESARSARSWHDVAVNRPARFEHNSIAVGDGQRTDESCRAIAAGHAAQLFFD